jgi:hypothetical protein
LGQFFGLSDAEHLADAAPDDRLGAGVGVLLLGRAGGDELAVSAVERGLLGSDDDRFDVIVRAEWLRQRCSDGRSGGGGR